MADLDPEANRLYARAEDLHPIHWEALVHREPSEAAEASGATWDGGAYLLPLLGRRLRVAPAERTVGFDEGGPAAVGYQRALVAVAYLAGALPAAPAGRFVAFRELPGGDGFFRGPHSVPTARLEAAFGTRAGALRAAAAKLGALPAAGADAAAELPALPRIPLLALVWQGTEEFPPRASLLVDARAHLHLPLDVLWALGNLAVGDLVRLAG